jgi:hypothetical protein
MIFDNEVQNGDIINSTIWNRAWGLNGTAKTLYDMIGAQQFAAQGYSAGSWIRGTQSITTSSVVQYSFISTTYQSNTRTGDFITWSQGYSVFNNARDTIWIQRSGYYIIHLEVGINDNANRIGNTANTDGTGIVPNVSMLVTIDTGSTFSFNRITNVVKASTGNSPQLNQPYYSAFASYCIQLNAGTQIRLTASLNSYAGRGERIVHSNLKAHLLKAM